MQNLLLIGNPNTGKTTLFNALTKSDEHVGNWNGVTVSEKEKQFSIQNKNYNLVDLPGIYSLSSLSYEEQVSIDYLISHNSDKIINICDMNFLQKNLYLSLELLEFGSNFSIFINNFDKKPKFSCNIEKLSNLLGITITSSRIKKISDYKFVNNIYCDHNSNYIDYIKNFIPKKLLEAVSQFADTNNLSAIWLAIKILENDEQVYKLGIDKNLAKFSSEYSYEIIAKARQEYIKKILNECNYKSVRLNKTRFLDKLFLNRYLAFPLFLIIMALVFYLTFFSMGKILSDLINSGFKSLSSAITNLPSYALLPKWLISAIEIGLLGGLSTVLSFLPQVGLIFMFLNILENSGYISRLAFMFDDIFNSCGLSGKSIYSLIMGLGCATSACLTCRNMEEKNAKIKTAIMLPYMSCSAKLPIYSVIGGVFFGVNSIFVIMALYLLGFIVSYFIAFFLNKTIFKSTKQSFLLEFTNYKLPNFYETLKSFLKNIWLFLIRIGGVLITVNIILWILQNFTAKFEYIDLLSTKESMLETFGRFISWIFIPLGFSSFGTSSALLAGLFAKEAIISSIVIFNGDSPSSLSLSTSPVHFTKASALSFLVFSLLYSPCLASISIMNKEISKKWTFLAVIIQFIIAYLITIIVYNIYRLILLFPVSTIISIITITLITLTIICSSKLLKKSSKNCKNCSKNI